MQPARPPTYIRTSRHLSFPNLAFWCVQSLIKRQRSETSVSLQTCLQHCLFVCLIFLEKARLCGRCPHRSFRSALIVALAPPSSIWRVTPGWGSSLPQRRVYVAFLIFLCSSLSFLCCNWRCGVGYFGLASWGWVGGGVLSGLLL